MLQTYKPILLNLGCSNTNFPFIEETFDSLTMYKNFCRLVGVVDYIQEYLKDLDLGQYTEYLDEQIANLKAYVDNKDSELYQYIDNQVDLAKNYTDEEITKLNLEMIQYILNQIQNIKKYSDAQDTLLKGYIEEEILKIQEEIDEIATKGIRVYNPATGQYDYLQNTLDDIYTYLRYYGITANEYDTLNLTADEYDNKKITARNYDLYAKQILMINWCCSMYSPISGEIKKISEVINELASQDKNEITAQEYDNLNLTAVDYDNKNITAYNFDWNGKTILIEG